MYVGRKYTATAEGAVWRPITCEHCRLQWAYKLVRKAEGTGSSPYFLDNDGASQRAHAEAQEELQKKLENDVEAIACPQCHKYQDAMIGEAKFDSVGHWYGIAMFVALAGLIFCAFWGHASFLTNWISLPGSLFFISALSMCFYAAIRSVMFEPNAEAHVEARRQKNEKPKAPVILRAEYDELAKLKPARGQVAEISWARAA